MKNMFWCIVNVVNLSKIQSNGKIREKSILYQRNMEKSEKNRFCIKETFKNFHFNELFNIVDEIDMEVSCVYLQCIYSVFTVYSQFLIKEKIIIAR